MDACLGTLVIKEVWGCIFVGGGAVKDDIVRWQSQGFQFCHYPSFGLRQSSGGPCAILAAVQAEILRSLLFSADVGCANAKSLPVLDLEQSHQYLAEALATIFDRRPRSSSLVLAEATWRSTDDVSLPPVQEINLFHQPEEASTKDFVFSKLPLFLADNGCLMFLFALVLNCGVDVLRADMDDPTNSLVGLYGHCSQELMNLLLTGRASSNVFDGNVSLTDSCPGAGTVFEDAFLAKGIQQRSEVGYLTHLESLRLCKVGSYLKIPQCPVWVVGSSSHFTVLFTLERDANKETGSDQLLTRMRRVFEAADPQQCGYILPEQLEYVLTKLDMDIVNCPSDLARLRGFLRMTNDGYIVWGSFWKNISKLISGRCTVDEIIDGELDGLHGVDGVEAPSAPLMLTNASNASNASTVPTTQIPVSSVDLLKEFDFSKLQSDIAASTATTQSIQPAAQVPQVHTRPRSDSDLARKLQAMMDAGDDGNFDFNMEYEDHSTTEHSTVGARDSSRPRSDSDLARELAREWVEADNDLPDLIPATVPVVSSSQTSTTAMPSSTDSHTLDLSRTDSVPITMYHFNGLERNVGSEVHHSVLTRFDLYRRQSVDVIGMAVPLSEPSIGMSHVCPIEEVLSTRWPGSRVDWLGSSSASID